MHYERQSVAGSIMRAVPHSKLDLSDKQIARIKTASGIVFALAAIAGTITLAAGAPNAIKLLGMRHGAGRLVKSREQKEKYRHHVLKSIYYLKKRGDIELVPNGKDFFLKITQKGRKK